jgi:hypothetical protein
MIEPLSGLEADPASSDSLSDADYLYSQLKTCYSRSRYHGVNIICGTVLHPYARPVVGDPIRLGLGCKECRAAREESETLRTGSGIPCML